MLQDALNVENGSQATDWLASLGFRFAKRGKKTVLVDRHHIGPLLVQSPFYPEGDGVSHVYVIHPPGGYVGGDRIVTNIKVSTGACGLVTTPGATKVYRCGPRPPVTQSLKMYIETNGILEWLPQETIYFNDARINSSIHVDLCNQGEFLGWDISCFGRPASGETLQLCNIRQKFEIWRDSRPLWIERTHFTDDCKVLNSRWGLQGYTVSGILVFTKRDDSLVRKIRDSVSTPSDALFSATALSEVTVCRYLGHHAEEAKNLLQIAWNIIRSDALGRNPVQPRIWNT